MEFRGGEQRRHAFLYSKKNHDTTMLVMSGGAVERLRGRAGTKMFTSSLGVIYAVEHLVQYHAYRIDGEDGRRILNPKWNSDCKHLLNLKSADERGFPAAVAYFSRIALEHLTGISLPPKGLQVHIVAVPSSAAGRWSPGVLRIGENLIKSNRNFVDSMRALPRIKTIDKLARGGDRSVWTHEQSIGLDDPMGRLPRKTILLLDDITTTGNSLMACAGILRTHAGVAQVVPLALGKTV